VPDWYARNKHRERVSGLMRLVRGYRGLAEGRRARLREEWQ
jgi:hypothetical protein